MMQDYVAGSIVYGCTVARVHSRARNNVTDAFANGLLTFYSFALYVQNSRVQISRKVPESWKVTDVNDSL